jgi:alpha-amylase
MSSFNFTDRDMGPPRDANDAIVAPEFDSSGLCTNGWVCEHRWHRIKEMVKFRNVVDGTSVGYWWSNGSNQIAFSRGSRGFIAFNGEYGVNLMANIQTGLPAGTYCDVATGEKSGSSCTGSSVVVDSGGVAEVFLSASVPQGFLAIHTESRL